MFTRFLTSSCFNVKFMFCQILMYIHLSIHKNIAQESLFKTCLRQSLLSVMTASRSISCLLSLKALTIFFLGPIGIPICRRSSSSIRFRALASIRCGYYRIFFLNFLTKSLSALEGTDFTLFSLKRDRFTGKIKSELKSTSFAKPDIDSLFLEERDPFL